MHVPIVFFNNVEDAFHTNALMVFCLRYAVAEMNVVLAAIFAFEENHGIFLLCNNRNPARSVRLCTALNCILQYI